MISVLHAIKGSRAPSFRPKIVPKNCKEIRKSWDASTKKAANLLKVSGKSFKGGRGDRTRTCDILVPNQERYQLRYTSMFLCDCKGTKKN